jgi:hypothetical protein
MITLSTDNASVNSIINDIKRLDAAGQETDGWTLYGTRHL